MSSAIFYSIFCLLLLILLVLSSANDVPSLYLVISISLLLISWLRSLQLFLSYNRCFSRSTFPSSSTYSFYLETMDPFLMKLFTLLLLMALFRDTSSMLLLFVVFRWNFCTESTELLFESISFEVILIGRIIFMY